MTGSMDTWPVKTESAKRVRLRRKVLCRTCMRSSYCPLWPKTVIECDKYVYDEAIVKTLEVK